MTTKAEHEAYNRTDWPGSDNFNPPHLRRVVSPCVRCGRETPCPDYPLCPPTTKPRWIMHESYAHLDTAPCAECGTLPINKTDRDVLLEIGNIIGGPACNYNSAVEVAEWRRRAARISDLVQVQLKGGK